MLELSRGSLAGRAGLPAAAGLAVAALAAVAGWLAVARPELFEVDLPSSPRALALVALVLLAAPAAFVALLRRPGVALAVLVVFVYLNLSQVLVRFHGLPSLLQLLALPLAVAGLRLRGREGAAAVATADLTVALAAWLAVLVASVTWAADPAAAGERVADIAKATAVYVLAALLADGARRLRVAAWAAVGSGSLLAAFGVWQALTETFDRDFGGLARIKQAQIYDDVFEPRIAGPLGDPNYFAQILLVLVPVALALAWGYETWSGRHGRRRLAALAAAGLLVAGTVLTYSRGAALALALVLGLAVLVRGIRPRHVAAGVAVVALLWVFAPEGFARRLTTLREVLPGGGQEVLRPDSSFAKRRLVTAAAWRMFLDAPLLGVGAGNYGSRFAPYADRVGSDARLYEDPGERNFPHNLYLEVAAETGALGLAVFALVVVAAFASLVGARRRCLARGDPRTAALAEGLGLALVGFLVIGLFLHGEFPRYLYLFLGLIAGLATTGRQEDGGGAAAEVAPRGGRGGEAPQEVGGQDVATAAPSGHESQPTPAAGDAAEAGALPERHECEAGPTGGGAAAVAVRVRRPVAVLLSRFPLVTETFILREVGEMERQGRPVVLVPLIRERPAVVHREAVPWLGRALTTPWLSPAIAAAVARAALRRPLALAGTALRLVAGTIGSPAMLWRSVALLPKSVLLAERLAGQGVRHLHAHYATHPATVALVASRLAPLDFSFTVHAHDLFVDRHLLGWKLRRAAFVRVISDFNRDFVARRYPWAAEKLVTVHVGVDPAEFRPAAGGAGAEGPAGEAAGDEPLILCVAALKEYKGVPVLVDACRRLRDEGVRFRCEVVGDGPLRDELAVRIEAAGLVGTVALLGARRQDEVARRLAAARVVVQPSVVAADGQMEGIPVALMEALSAERPVVASRLSGIPELVVDGETGLLVEPGDAAALAAAMRRLLDDPDLGTRLGRAGRRRVEEGFTLAGTTAELLAQLDRHDAPPEGEAAALAAAGVLAMGRGDGSRGGGPAKASAPNGPARGATAGAAPASSSPPAPNGPTRGPAAGAAPASTSPPAPNGPTRGPAAACVTAEPSPTAPDAPTRGAASASSAASASLPAVPGAAVGLRRVHRGLDAEVAEVLVPAAPGEAATLRIVKRHLDRPGASRRAAERARREAAVAARVAAWDGAPRPLGVDEEQAVVVFAPCPGEPLDALVRRLRFRGVDGRLAEALGAAGRWLARFQQTPLADLVDGAVPAAGWAQPHGCAGPDRSAAGRTGAARRGAERPRADHPGRDVAGAHRSGADRRDSDRRDADLPGSARAGLGSPAAEGAAVADARPADPAPGPSIEPRLRRRLDRLRDRARPESLALVPVHGDLWPGNLLFDGTAARALDYEGAGLGPRYADAAWFLLHLDLYLARPGLGGRRRALRDAFLAGWLGDAGSADRAALTLFRGEAAALLLRRSPRGGGARARWRRRQLRRELALATAEGAS